MQSKELQKEIIRKLVVSKQSWERCWQRCFDHAINIVSLTIAEAANSEWARELQNNIAAMEGEIEKARRQQNWDTVLYCESKIEEYKRLLKLAQNHPSLTTIDVNFKETKYFGGYIKD